MGLAEFGGGGSVNCVIKFNDAGADKFRDKDQVNQPPGDVGKSKGHGGFFKIRLKFENRNDRDDAYESVTKLGNDMIIMFVKAYTNEPDQIRIDW